MTDAIVVGFGVEGGESAAVRDLVLDWAGGTTDRLLDGTDVHTVSVFLDAGDSPSLVWYVEVEDDGAPRWTDAPATVREASPLFGAGLDEYLVENAGTRVDGDGGATLLEHARHPRRPAAFDPGRDDVPVIRSIGSDGEVPANPPNDDAVEAASTSTGGRAVDGGGSVEVVLLRLSVRPGLAERLARGLARVMNLFDDDGRVEGAFEEWSEPVLEDEGMYTETVYLDEGDHGQELLWYMEARSMDRVLEAYFETDNLVARVSEIVLNRLLVEPERMFEDPAERAGAEWLVHAVDPDRP